MIKSYVVRAGDHLAKIAHNAGLDPDTIWNHPKNKELREKRSDPNLLAEGDVLFLPLEDDAPLPLKIGGHNRFSGVVPELETRLRFRDAAGPYVDEPYVVEGLDEPLEGRTDAEGALTLCTPVTVRVAKISFPQRGRSFTVRLGDMDPISEISGVQLRLAALGFFKGTPTGRLDDFTERALMNFQASRHMAETGKPDAATLEALRVAYGC